MKFNLNSSFKPTGDQPQAIKELSKGIENKEKKQLLLGVTGSGKTFTMANVIEKVQKPTLILSHNKTLAAQLYSEFSHFFPNNAVEYFVSYYDYYQPEAYIPTTGTYIEKDLSINEQIEKLRLRTTSSLLSGRRDVLVVASVSCLYGIGNPEEFKKNIISIKKGEQISINTLLEKLVQSLYKRTEEILTGGHFKVKGDTVEIFLSHAENPYKIHFFGDEIEDIEIIQKDKANEFYDSLEIYPANIFVSSPDTMKNAIDSIQLDLGLRVKELEENYKKLEAKRLYEKTTFDLEMIREMGYCSGIENYSRYFDQRLPGERPFCLIDFFPEDFILFIDESHVTIPQIHAMFGGDKSRKANLVDYGFRLPSALDNRPLKYNEFESLLNQTIYVSATPSEYEFKETQGVYVEQIIRPTGLLDPIIEIRPSKNQIDNLIEEIQNRTIKNERTIITTLTKKMAEELTSYLIKSSIRTQYIHSDVDTLERVKIIDDFKKGLFDVLVGVNLLREGIDIPQVSLVAILDADKEGFLRSHRSLTQTIGRAARNINGTAILYADKITNSMQKTIDETDYKRNKQIEYNKQHNITPKALNSNPSNISSNDTNSKKETNYNSLSKKDLQKIIRIKQKEMEQAAKEFEFIVAKELRDTIKNLKNILETKQY